MNGFLAVAKGWIFCELATLIVASTLVSCGTTKTPNSEDVHNTFMIMIDRSASISTGQSNAYLRYLKKLVFASMTPGSRVIIEPIAGPGTRMLDADLSVDTSLPSLSEFHKNWLYYIQKGDTSEDEDCDNKIGAELKTFVDARNQLALSVQRILHEKGASSNTFLLDGMREASDALAAKSGQRVLIVLTDGLEDSDEFGQDTNFNNPSFWANKNPEDLVKLLDESDFQGLKGVDVYMYGVGSIQKVNTSISKFWHSFFKAAGADPLNRQKF